ncbi:MAG: 30S ribosome-binding factor RbfA [Prevotella sp.]|nr:30S ribosome-binding factor RbfA [Prevotella sp.]
MPNFRNGRLSEDIKREISGLIREEIKDPRVNAGLVSVVRTELSGDSSHCKVYISSLDGEEAAKTAVKGLESASGMMKRQISNRLRLRKCPELKFIADNSIEHSAEIARMLESIEETSDASESERSEDKE